MKLIRRININFFIASLSILILMGLALTVVLNYVVKKQFEEKLRHTYERVQSRLDSGQELSSFPPFFEITTTTFQPDTIYFGDDRRRSGRRKHSEEFIMLHAAYNQNGTTYDIVIRESVIETDDLFESIITVVLVTIVIMLVTLYLINRKLSQIVWQSFYLNLDEIRQFSINRLQTIRLNKTSITEFNLLNEAVNNLTDKVLSDYNALKQFSEDASHELQTPLAIIRSKVESLLNANDLSIGQVEKLRTIYETTNRLTRLNKDLLLLAKLDNKQFDERDAVSFNTLIKNQFEEWQEIIHLSGLSYKCDQVDVVDFEINRNLAKILISNLLSNAINHTPAEGVIVVIIKGRTIAFYNSGNKPILHPETIFNRFHKEVPGKNSNGLGLAIVKKICETYGISITYTFDENLHTFTLTFPD